MKVRAQTRLSLFYSHHINESKPMHIAGGIHHSPYSVNTVQASKRKKKCFCIMLQKHCHQFAYNSSCQNGGSGFPGIRAEKLFSPRAIVRIHGNHIGMTLESVTEIEFLSG